ncbi:MAG TPA: hypothetical protein VHF89_02060 [Solirubrobacteraceae bacterium]|nr:hypothetical protein [Solirubrobacteraceae bacterium]
MNETEAVSVAFGDRAAGLYGVARTGMGILFDGDEPVAVRTDGVRIDGGDPQQPWRATLDGVFELEVEALASPAEVALGGISGYEQLCRVRGTAGGRSVDCLGQRGRSWGRLDLSKLALARTVSAWLDEQTAVTVSAIRDQSAKHHADEEIAAHLVLGGNPVPVADPRLSTRYDGEGRHVHAGLELWVSDGDGEFPHRAAGDVLCGTTLDLGSVRLDCAFFEWHMDGRTGVGRYDVLRRAG